MTDIGGGVRMCRRRKGLTQRELSAQVMISHQQISLYELGRSIPTADTLVLLGDALGVTPNDLVGYANHGDAFAGCSDDERAFLRRVVCFALGLYREHVG